MLTGKGLLFTCATLGLFVVIIFIIQAQFENELNSLKVRVDSLSVVPHVTVTPSPTASPSATLTPTVKTTFFVPFRPTSSPTAIPTIKK